MVSSNGTVDDQAVIRAMRGSGILPASAKRLLGQLRDPGFRAFKRLDYSSALVVWRAAADKGNAQAQYNIGWMYDLGLGVAQSDEQAVRWYRSAALKGHPEAQAALGWMHQHGRGVEQNGAEAVGWYRRAAGQGLASAMSCLGWMYSSGEGVAKSEALAFQWWLRAAARGDALAQYYLGRAYRFGLGVEASDAAAVRWLRKALGAGVVDAANALGTMFEEGRGVKRDLLRAHALYCLSVSRSRRDQSEERERARQGLARVVAKMSPAELARAESGRTGRT
jgi:TPR repeat protein